MSENHHQHHCHLFGRDSGLLCCVISWSLGLYVQYSNSIDAQTILLPLLNYGISDVTT